METWRLCRTDGGGWQSIEEQPSDGFPGPGRAWRWLSERGQAELLGVELFVVRDDGARPVTIGDPKYRARTTGSLPVTVR